MHRQYTVEETLSVFTAVEATQATISRSLSVYQHQLHNDIMRAMFENSTDNFLTPYIVAKCD